MDGNKETIAMYWENFTAYMSNLTHFADHHSDEIQSVEKLHSISRIISTIASVLGVIGNTLSVVLLHRLSKASDNVMSLLLKILAFVDNFFLFIFAFSIWHSLLNVDDEIMVVVGDVTAMLFGIARFCTIYMTVLIAFMHYIAVCKPFKAAKICTKKNAWIAMATGLTLNITIHIPMLCIYNSFDITDGKFVVDYGQLFFSDSYQYGYELVFLQMLTFGLIPLSAFAFCTVKIIVGLPKPSSDGTQTELSAAQRKEAKDVTRVVVAILVVFIFTNIPRCVTDIINEVNRFYHAMESLGYVFSVVSYLLLMLNSSINFVIYYLLRASFRKELKCLFRRCCHNNE